VDLYKTKNVPPIKLTTTPEMLLNTEALKWSGFLNAWYAPIPIRAKPTVITTTVRSLLLDDPDQHIDDYRALNLVEVLTAIRRTGRQVIVSVEDTALANVLCRRLRSASGDIGRIFDLHTSKSGTAEVHSTHDIYPMPQLVLRAAQAS